MKIKLIMPFFMIATAILLLLSNNYKMNDTQAAAAETHMITASKEAHAMPDASPVSGITVYITDTGECYHTENCASLKHSRTEVDLEYAERFYRPCKQCHPEKLKKAA